MEKREVTKLTFSNSFFPSLLGLVVMYPLAVVIGLILVPIFGALGLLGEFSGSDIFGFGALFSLGIIAWGVRRWVRRNDNKQKNG